MSAALNALIAGCRILCRPRSQGTDADLLRRFTQERDASAFEELLERHAALVWGVCRRILLSEADCEDVFQATFLALVRRGGAINARPSLGAWLHTVALRAARKALLRSRRQQPQAILPDRAAPRDVADEAVSRELVRLVDEEIERLPAAVREPLILCCLQGRTRDEAAEALGYSVAAVKRRLERGRDLLRRRLQRRGVQLPAAFLVLGLTASRVSASLRAKALQSVLGSAPATVAALVPSAGFSLSSELALATMTVAIAGVLSFSAYRAIPADLSQLAPVANDNRSSSSLPRSPSKKTQPRVDQLDDRKSLELLAEKALKAAGGGKLRSVKAWTFTEKIRHKDGRTSTYRRYFQLPDRFRTEIEIEGDDKQLYKSAIIINGDKGWSVSERGTEKMSAEMIAAWWKGAFWVSAPILGPSLLSDPNSTLTRLAEIKIGDRAALGVKMARQDYGITRLYFDKETGRLLKIEQDYRTEDGKEGVTEVMLSDFRVVSGISVPHKKTQRDGGKVTGVWNVTDYKFADVLDAKQFEKPSKLADKPAFVTEFLAIKREVEVKQSKLEAAFKKEHVASRTEGERAAALRHYEKEWHKVMSPAIEKVMTSVRPHAADLAAVETLVWVADHSYGSYSGNEAAELLRKHHLIHKQTIDLVYRHTRGPLKWTEPLLRTQLAAAGLATADRPRLLYALAQVKQTHGELSRRLVEISDDQLSSMECFYGKDTLAGIRKIDPAHAEAEAIRLYTELNENYGSDKLDGEITYGELAKSAIFEIQNLSVGKMAPEIIGEDIDGMRFKLSDYRGRVVLLSFWGTWCGGCMVQVPHEREIVERLKDRPFALLGVNSDEDKTKLKKAMREARITWRSFWCGEKGPRGEIARAWNVNGWPTVYVLDHKGIIRAKNVTSKDLDRILDKLISDVSGKN
ncbi:MAG TPA: sigma-70 family RNA polymerase sigma factor [Gemmataceae bacterium]|nr:sigma-70 family RNA polymerase sigma factor [Gemmataceae bacterium]